MSVSEHTKLLNSGYHLTGTRWYVVAMVSMANILSNQLWAMWGSISDSAKYVYDWTDGELFLIIMLGNSAFLATLPACYLIDRKGIRVSILACVGTMAVASGLKCITMTTGAKLLICISQFLSGVASSVTMTIPPAVSETWFGVHERTTATAISSLAAPIGAGVAFVLGPMVVTMPTFNGTRIIKNETDFSEIQSQVRYLNYGVFGFSVVLFLACVAYLPARPDKLPSKTAGIARYTFSTGLRKLLTNPSLWMIGCMYAIPIGIYGNWGTVLNVLLQPLGISQSETGWMDFYSSVGGTVSGLVISRFADMFRSKTKLLITICYLVATGCFVWFTCMCLDVVPRTVGFLYISVILSGVCISSCGPLFIEITCELAYPIGEGLTAGFLSMFTSFAAAAILLIGLIPKIGTEWMNWVLSAAFTVTIPLLLMLRVHSRRTQVDMQATTADNPPGGPTVNS